MRPVLTCSLSLCTRSLQKSTKISIATSHQGNQTETSAGLYDSGIPKTPHQTKRTHTTPFPPVPRPRSHVSRQARPSLAGHGGWPGGDHGGELEGPSGSSARLGAKRELHERPPVARSGDQKGRWTRDANPWCVFLETEGWMDQYIDGFVATRYEIVACLFCFFCFMSPVFFLSWGQFQRKSWDERNQPLTCLPGRFTITLHETGIFTIDT